MELTDAIVTDNGQLDDLGNLLSANADKVRHQGIEIVGAYEPVDHLKISGNFSLSEHKFVKYSEVDWNTWELTSRDGNRIGQDPEYLGNLQVDHEHGNFLFGIGARFVGEQFTDNSEDEATAIDAYTVATLDLGYRLKNLPGNVPLAELRLHVDNLFDTEFETVGYGDTYIVGAPRAIYTTLAVEL
jgi:iron complex outermembrane receptor protein